MKKVFWNGLVIILIFMQLGASPRIHPDDPVIHYQDDFQDMESGALIGAAVYLVSKVFGYTIGDTEIAQAIREKLPFMAFIIPPSGWLGWKEECLNLSGFMVTGAAMGSYGSSGEIAQQFQFAFSDALSQRFLEDIVRYIGSDDSPKTPFIDLVMVKTASQIIRDELIPAGIPPFRGKSTEIMILNAATELTAMTLIGAVEGAAVAALYTDIRDLSANRKEIFDREMMMNAAYRAMDTFNTIIYLGPRVHVSEKEREIINNYAKARGVDIRWALDHAQFRDGASAVVGKHSVDNDKVYAYAQDRHIVFQHPFDPRHNPYDPYVGFHEAYHLNQNAETPNWIYMRVKYPEYRRQSDISEHDEALFEQFPSKFRQYQ